ncbi:MAG: RNA-binding protein [Roseburia sp.]
MSDSKLTEKRFFDLAKQANRKGIVCFSDFLTLNELNIFQSLAGQLESNSQIYGGYEGAERQMVAFIPDALYYEWEYPITCLQIVPSYPKFAEELSHRDILGALMNLGIDRNKLGDILIGEGSYYFFCKQEMSNYLIEQLNQIRHTQIYCEVVPSGEVSQLRPNTETVEKIVASNRMDGLIAAITGISRSQAVAMINAGKIAINGAECLNHSYQLKAQDVISIRGFGKYIFKGISGETKKNRLKVTFLKYI